MATELTKKVVRKTHALYMGRAVIIELTPPSMIIFRLKGLHSKFPLSVSGALDLAMKIEANHQIEERRKKQAEKRLLRRQQRGI